jgi:hypothetical protein
MSEELSPRQIEFLRLYNNPKSETFGNALQSALKAGYSQDYAESLTAQCPEWFSENLGRRKRMLSKAEIVLEESLDWEDERLKLDSAKFIAKTLGKDEGYSDRTEHTGKDGASIKVEPIYGGLSKHNSDQEDIQPQETN